MYTYPGVKGDGAHAVGRTVLAIVTTLEPNAGRLNRILLVIAPEVEVVTHNWSVVDYETDNASN
jgi:hypothetical protein